MKLLEKAEEDIKALGGKVVLISFGVREGALRWLEETKCPFPMLLDSKRKIYAEFGLGRSVAKVWSVSAMIYYAEKMAQGEPLPGHYDHDDTQQMGGDFVLDKEGKMTLVYCSQQSWDRPTIPVILNALKVKQDSQ